MSSDIHALSGAYAVDALDDAERQQFELHLAECDVCQAEVDSLREASALLAETTMTMPSPELRDRVLAQISTVRPLPPHTQPASHRADAGSNVVTLAPRRRRRAATFLAAAAAVVAIGAGGVVWNQVSGDGPQSQTEQVIGASDAHQFTTDLTGGGKAVVTVSKKLNEAVFEAHSMATAPEGKQYVLWLRHGSTMTQAGVLPSGADNTVLFSGDAATADGAAVSVEDAGTAPTEPSDDVVAAISFDV